MIEIKDIEKLAELARLEVPQEEKETLRQDLEVILNYVGKIKEVGDASAKAQKEQSIDTALVRNVLREDGIPHETGLYTEVLLNEAPKREGDYLKVKKIL